MERHRNVWLALAAILSAFSAAFFARECWAWGPLAAAAAISFGLAVRQVPFPFLRGAEAALLHRALRKLYEQIEALEDPTEEDAERLFVSAETAYKKYAPHRIQDVRNARFRAGDQPPATKLEFLRQEIANTMMRLEEGGSA